MQGEIELIRGEIETKIRNGRVGEIKTNIGKLGNSELG